MVKVVDESVILVLINVEQGACTSLDSLDDPDIVGETSSPPSVNSTAAVLHGQTTSFSDWAHHKCHEFLLASEERSRNDGGFIVTRDVCKCLAKCFFSVTLACFNQFTCDVSEHREDIIVHVGQVRKNVFRGSLNDILRLGNTNALKFDTSISFNVFN